MLFPVMFPLGGGVKSEVSNEAPFNDLITSWTSQTTPEHY